MSLFVSKDNPQEEYDSFIAGVSAGLQPKDGGQHAYILDIREDAMKTQYYVNVMLQLLQSKGYEIVDVQYQYALSVYSHHYVFHQMIDASNFTHTPQRERSIMFLYK